MINKQSFLFTLASAVLISILCVSAYAYSAAKARGYDATGNQTEEPSASYNGKGDVEVRFAADNSPRLEKWWNSRILVSCPAGYHFSIDRLRVSHEVGSTDSPIEDATCEPNESAKN